MHARVAGVFAACLIVAGCGERGAETTQQGASSSGSAATDGREYGVRPDYATCLGQVPGGADADSRRQDCAEQELDFQDTRLNDAYTAHIDGLRGREGPDMPQATALRKAQRAWMDSVDETCAADIQGDDGNKALAEQSACYLQRTVQRAHELEQQLRKPASIGAQPRT